MTRETKISLLVGLAFIIVIGILLSDHFHATQELPQAVLAQGADIMRRATNEPGTANPPINFVTPNDTTPTQQLPTHDELTRPPSPVVPSSNYQNQQNVQAQQANPAPPAGVQDHGADAPSPDQSLIARAQRGGEPLVPANQDGTSRDVTSRDVTPRMIEPSPTPDPTPATGGPKQHKAEDGDTVSRMAAKFMGSNTKANRQAIIDANPSLQEDPDRVIVGKTYVIPVAGGSAREVAQAPTVDSPRVDSPRSVSGEYIYTVQEGDSLWAIANDQLGDPAAVDAIKELNRRVLKGENHDVVTPGMKLRLPAKPVATAQN
jgi:nucleoid-associated protein YgaU